MEDTVGGGEIGGEGGLEAVELPANLFVVFHGGAEGFAGFFGFFTRFVEGGSGFFAEAVDFGAGVVDEGFGVGAGVDGGFELGELFDEVFELLLVGIGLFELALAEGADLAEFIAGDTGAGFGLA